VKEPVDHILRPTLPWRDATQITECGFNAASVPTLTREEFFARMKDLGQRRTAMMTCMTCAQTAARWGTWDDDPRRALEREIQWETAWRRSDRGELLRDKLLAVASLIEAHRDEFDALLKASEQRREWLVRKAANAAAKARQSREDRGRSL
jgi:hypothetical protein